MSLNAQARSVYGSASVRTPRGTEYAAFARVTSGLKSVDPDDRRAYPALVRAIAENQRLWRLLEEDLLSDENQLPLSLRSNLLSLASFIRKQSTAVIGGHGSVDVLVDINTAIMKGLRGEIEEVA